MSKIARYFDMSAPATLFRACSRTDVQRAELTGRERFHESTNPVVRYDDPRIGESGSQSRSVPSQVVEHERRSTSEVPAKPVHQPPASPRGATNVGHEPSWIAYQVHTLLRGTIERTASLGKANSPRANQLANQSSNLDGLANHFWLESISMSPESISTKRKCSPGRGCGS